MHAKGESQISLRYLRVEAKGKQNPRTQGLQCPEDTDTLAVSEEAKEFLVLSPLCLWALIAKVTALWILSLLKFLHYQWPHDQPHDSTGLRPETYHQWASSNPCRKKPTRPETRSSMQFGKTKPFCSVRANVLLGVLCKSCYCSHIEKIQREW